MVADDRAMRALGALGMTMSILVAGLAGLAGPAAAAAVPSGGGPGDPLDDAVAMAHQLAAQQAADLGFAVAQGPALQGFATPSGAVGALLARFDETPTAEQAEAIAALDLLPPEKAAALAGLVDAYLAFEQAAQRAYADADPAVLAAAAEGAMAMAQAVDAAVARDPRELLARPAEQPDAAASLGELGVDYSQLFGARAALLDATAAFARAFAPGESGTDAVPPPLVVAPALVLDLQGLSDAYTLDVALSIDVGGSDTYLNNAGGVSRYMAATATTYGCSENHPFAAAALIDLAGDDTRNGLRQCGTNGGAGYEGAGFSFDLGGDDYYRGEYHGVNGGGLFFGAGFLLDVAGSDTYSANNYGVNGGAFAGAGLLVDAAGGDVYQALYYAINGGALGLGFPAYLACTAVTSPTCTRSVGTASGILADLDGDDVYTGGNYGVNGGSFGLGHGKLLDLAGSDRYVAGSVGVNGGAYLGVGLLADAAGNDRYQAAGIGANGGAGFGAGTLLDLAGNDSYDVYDPNGWGSNGGAHMGVGLAVDVAGDDVWQSSGAIANGRASDGCYLYDPVGALPVTGTAPLSQCWATIPALALAIDLNGHDLWWDPAGGYGVNRSIVLWGFLGAQLDTCLAQAPSFSGLPSVTAGSILVSLAGASVQLCAPKVTSGGTPALGAWLPDGVLVDACRLGPFPGPVGSVPCSTGIDVINVLLPPNAAGRQCTPAMAIVCLGIPVHPTVPGACQVVALACFPTSSLDGVNIVTVPATPGFPVLTQPSSVSVAAAPLVVGVTPNLGETNNTTPAPVFVPTPFGDVTVAMCQSGCPTPVLPDADVEGGAVVGATVNGQSNTVAVPLRV